MLRTGGDSGSDWVRATSSRRSSAVSDDTASSIDSTPSSRACDVRHGKPAPDIYLEVARRLDVQPHACLVLEDSAIGCEAALAAGMRVVACPSVVTAHCPYPEGISRVQTLHEIAL